MSRALGVPAREAKELFRPSVYYWNVKVLRVDSNGSLNLLLRTYVYQYLVCFASRERLLLGLYSARKNGPLERHCPQLLDQGIPTG